MLHDAHRLTAHALSAVIAVAVGCGTAETDLGDADDVAIAEDVGTDATVAVDAPGSDDAAEDAADAQVGEVAEVGDEADTVPTDTSDAGATDTASLGPVCAATCRVAGRDAPAGNEVYAAPLDILVCSAEGSFDPDGGELAFAWEIVDRPLGAREVFDRDDAPETTLFLDLAGWWVLRMTATDGSGRDCATPADVVVLAVTPSDIDVELTWYAPLDPDPTDDGFATGADVDLHLLHPNGCWEDPQWDCHFRAPSPNWGNQARSDDDPSLDIDDTSGAGLERVVLNDPEAGATYRVGVHYWNDHGFGAAIATVRIYVGGALAYEASQTLDASDVFWDVATIAWPSGEIGAVNGVTDGIPACE